MPHAPVFALLLLAGLTAGATLAAGTVIALQSLGIWLPGRML